MSVMCLRILILSSWLVLMLEQVEKLPSSSIIRDNIPAMPYCLTIFHISELSNGVNIVVRATTGFSFPDCNAGVQGWVVAETWLG